MRSRNLKPGFFTNEFLIDLGWGHAILFEGLWGMTDRRGVLEDRPGQIRAKLPILCGKPPFHMTAEDVDRALDDLQRQPNRFIKRYRAQGVALIKVLNFWKHQTPHVHEKATEHSDYEPVPYKTDTSTANGETKTSVAPSDSSPLIPVSFPLIPDPSKDVKKVGDNASPTKAPKAPKPRKAKPPRENWQSLYDHVFLTWQTKRNGRKPLITVADCGILGQLYDGFTPWVVMAAWTLWLMDGERWSEWAYENGHSVATFFKKFNALTADPRVKDKAAGYERLAAAGYVPKADELAIDPAKLLAGNFRVPVKR